MTCGGNRGHYLEMIFRAAVLGSLLLLPAAAAAAPQSVKLSWASADAGRSMAITWVTDATAPTSIEYGINSTSENALTGNMPDNIVGIGYLHEIEITGLQPDTTYRYRVGSAGDWSPEYTFKTAPVDQCTPFSFVSLGDARSQNSRGPSLNWSSIHQEAEAAGAEFFLNGGDLVKEGTEIAQWAQWLIDSDAVNPFKPMMPAIGNHDDGPGDGNSANYNRLFALPTNPVTGTEDYYYFVYNNLVVFSMSTQTFEDWGAQTQWLIDVAAQHPNKWKLAYFHHPVYTTETRAFGIQVGHEPNEKGQNSAYGPAFDTAGIDVVIQSHNHIYERFAPLRYDPSDPEQGQVVGQYGGPNGGRLYIVSGGSGAFLDPLIEGNLQRFANGSTARSKDHHYIRLSIAGNNLQVDTLRTQAGNSSGGGTVIDQLSIVRPGPDPCSNPQDPDMDGDGYPASTDCQDDNPMVNPGATEICGNAVDENCDDVAEDCPPPPVVMDGDGSPEGTDCDDNNPNRYPELAEVECDGIDNDCDCNESCNGNLTDVCADAGVPDQGTTPPDTGAVVDAGQAADVPVAAEDASAAADATAAPDSGQAPPVKSDGCGCRAEPQSDGGFGLIALFVLTLGLRFKRRT